MRPRGVVVAGSQGNRRDVFAVADAVVVDVGRVDFDGKHCEKKTDFDNSYRWFHLWLSEAATAVFKEL